MQSIINYIVESGVSLCVLSLFYVLVLHNSKQLQFKRWYLLVALVFATLVPLANFTFSSGQDAVQVTGISPYYMLDTFTVTAGEMTDVTVPVVERHNWIGWVYWLGFLLLIVRLTAGLVRIGLMKNLFYSTNSNTYRLFITEGNYHPFSFFHWVFIPKPLWENGSGKVILAHEQEHSRQWHSIDILLLELVLIVQWFNPFAWVIRKAIKDNHEFLADRAVLDSGVSQKEYFQSMLFPVMGAHFGMANNFNVSITKKRITMMKSKNNKKNTGLLAALSFVLITSLFLMFACETDGLLEAYANTETAFVVNGQLVLPQEVLSSDNEKTDDLVRVTINGEEQYINPDLSANLSYAKVLSTAEAMQIYSNLDLPAGINQVVVIGENDDQRELFTVCEQMPMFPGGDDSLMKYLALNVKYPVAAQQAGTQGRVYIGFVVDTTGIVRNVSVHRSVDPYLDAEALRVVKNMPLWSPGLQRGHKVNVRYVMPINFALQQETVAERSAKAKMYVVMTILNGEVMLKKPEIKKLSFSEAKAYVLKYPDTHVTVNSTDDMESVNKLVDFITSGVNESQLVHNNAVFYRLKTESREKFEKDKEQLGGLVSTLDGVKLDSYEGKDGVYWLYVQSTENRENIPSNPELRKYILNAGGHVIYSSMLDINQIEEKPVVIIEEVNLTSN